MCLLEDLPKVFTPGEVSMMDTETLMVLASEPDSLRRERIRLQKKREDLRTALKTCIQNAARATPGLSIICCIAPTLTYIRKKHKHVSPDIDSACRRKE